MCSYELIYLAGCLKTLKIKCICNSGVEEFRGSSYSWLKWMFKAMGPPCRPSPCYWLLAKALKQPVFVLWFRQALGSHLMDVVAVLLFLIQVLGLTALFVWRRTHWPHKFIILSQFVWAAHGAPKWFCYSAGVCEFHVLCCLCVSQTHLLIFAVCSFTVWRLEF